MTIVKDGKINLSNVPVTNGTGSNITLYINESSTAIAAKATSAPVSGIVKSVSIQEILASAGHGHKPFLGDLDVDPSITWSSTNTTMEILFRGSTSYAILTDTESGKTLEVPIKS